MTFTKFAFCVLSFQTYLCLFLNLAKANSSYHLTNRYVITHGSVLFMRLIIHRPSQDLIQALFCNFQQHLTELCPFAGSLRTRLYLLFIL